MWAQGGRSDLEQDAGDAPEIDYEGEEPQQPARLDLNELGINKGAIAWANSG